MVYIRADSNPTISGGHIMRCLAIADELIEQGERVCFLIADGNSAPVLNEHFMPYVNLHSDWQDLMSDVLQVGAILEADDNAILLIDTYQVSKDYVERLKPYAKVAYLGSKREYLGELDLLINYSTCIDYDFYYQNYNANTLLLLGPSYAPLRKEFQNAHPSFKKGIHRVLVTTGNTDNDRIIPLILEEIVPFLSEFSIKVDVVMGRMFTNKDELHQVYGNSEYVSLYENVKAMSSLMLKSDLAITANGTTIYELSAMGVPALSFSMVPEQVSSAEALSELGVVDYCGRSFEDKGICVNQILERLRFYVENDKSRVQLAQRAHELINGNGVQSIVNAIRTL